jgi:hypothetical protein
MKTPHPRALWAAILGIAILSGSQFVLPQTPGTPRDYEDILKPFPPKDFLKLRGNSKEETAMEFSKKLTTSEVGKAGSYRVKVAKVEAWPFPAEGITGWRVTGDAEKIRIGSVSLRVSVFAYIPEDSTGIMAKLKRGQTLLVTGELSRCDVTAVDEPVLNLDVRASSVTSIAK